MFICTLHDVLSFLKITDSLVPGNEQQRSDSVLSSFTEQNIRSAPLAGNRTTI